MSDSIARLSAALANRYQFEHELGRGGMASVHLAVDLQHHRHVAVKVLDPELAGAIGPERFLREIGIAARLTHPNILSLYDWGEGVGLPYYTMPYVEGESLRARLDRERHLSVDEAVAIIRQVADALDFAHREGVIHRDIKPENILLSGDRAVVADFGIARAIDAAGGERLTSTGISVGTPAYMSPEQVGAERRLDGRTDLYSLGCVVYEMLGGAPPFTGPTVQAVMARHAVDPPPRLKTLRPSLPDEVEAVVQRALAKIPKDRYATAGEFAEALARAGSAESSAVAHDGAIRITRARTFWIAGVLVVLAAGWWLLTLTGGPEIRRFAVLPFDDPSGDASQAYFSEGLHEALIADLSRDGLGVIARTSVLQYRRSDKPVRVIAQELAVDALVETSLHRSPDSVTIEARLVDGRTEQYLWSHAYAVETARVPTLAMTVARGIAEAISPGTSEPFSPGAVAPVDPVVYDAYLQGRSYLHRPTRADLETAREYFERALARDSTYAPAWAGVSQYWTIGRQRDYFTPQESTPPSQAAAYKATSLDSNLAEAHHALAEAKVYGEWDWEGGEREFRRTLELRPDYAEARAFYAHLLCIVGRPNEALQQLQRARELDPLDPLVAWISGATFAIVGRYDDAITLYRRALMRSPGNSSVLWLLWMTLDNAGRYQEADSAAQQWATASGDSAMAGALDQGRRQGGYRAAILAGADYLASRAETTHISAWDVALWYAIAHDDDDAVTWLQRAFDERDPTMPYLEVHPSFKRLHQDPRFRELLRRMDLASRS